MEALIIVTFSLCAMQVTQATSSTQPNFVILLMDDVGYGDITSFWNPNNMSASTPFIDHMASNGIRFTDFNSAATTCAPSRASLLTARLGARTGLNNIPYPSTRGGLPINETTFGETFSKAGYKTGMIGKWHVGVQGDFHPNSRALPLLNGRKVVEQPLNMTNLSLRYTKAAEVFIKDRETTTPFILYVGLQHMHVPFFIMPEFAGKSARGDAYGDALLEMDWVIDTIVKVIEDNGEAENTLIWVTSDNGPPEAQCHYGGNPGPFLGLWQRTIGGGGSSSKHTVWEGGHRMPALAYWPGTIEGGRVSDELVLYHPLERYENGLYNGTMGAVRLEKYKAVYMTGGTPECGGLFGPSTLHDPPLIFNVKEDPMESTPIDSGSPEYQSVLMEVNQAQVDLKQSLRQDNTSIADYTLNYCVMPCCNPLNVVCRCD